MNIDLIITEMNFGGAERALTQLAIGLRDRGDDVRLFSFGKLPSADSLPKGNDRLVQQLHDEGIEVTSGGVQTSRGFLPATIQLRRWLARRPGSLIQTFLWHANVLGMLNASSQQPRVAGIRVAEPNSLRLAVERQTLRNVDHVVCVSRAVETFAQQQLNLSPDRTSVIPNAVDVDAFASADPIDWTDLGWPADSPVVLFVGRLHTQKGLEHLQRTVERFAPENSHRKLVLIGNGPLQNELATWAKQVSGDRVRVLTWQSNIASWIAASRVVVLPSRYEGMPNVILEAMAAGKPVVSSRVEGSQELIGHDPNQGFELNDDTALVHSLERFLADEDLATQTGQANQSRVRSQFTVEAMVDAYRELYAKIVA
jgi:starch synthase (maltosyl-transferring)